MNRFYGAGSFVFMVLMVSLTTAATAQSKASLVTTWPKASAIAHGQALSRSTLSDGVATVEGTFSFTNGAIIPPTGTYSAAVTFMPTDMGTYSAEEGYVDVTVNQTLIWYVTENGAGDGTSWDSPLGSIQAAIDIASSGEQVWVGEGDYSPEEDPMITMKDGVALYGGFMGAETAIDQRDIEAHKTTIDGKGTHQGIIGATAILDGFYLWRPISNNNGGAMYNVNVTPTIRNCEFSSSSARNLGGAVYNEFSSGTIEITNCRFWANRLYDTSDTGNHGGCAVYNKALGGTVAITGCSFESNSGPTTNEYYGGAIYNDLTGGVVTTVNCLFSGNLIELGGAIYNNVATAASSADIVNCTFASNAGMITTIDSVDYAGDAVFNKISAGAVNITNCILWENTDDDTIVEIGNFQGSGYNTPTVTYSCVRFGYSGTGNISTDPLFSNAGNKDLWLTPTSPCINAGVANPLVAAIDRDLVNLPRLSNAAYDMGAYEYPYTEIQWPSSATGIIHGQTLADSILSADGVPPFSGSFTFADPTIAPPVGIYEATLAFVPTDREILSMYGAGAAGAVSVRVQASSLVRSWPTASAITVGQTLADAPLNGGEALKDGVFAFQDETIAPPPGTYSAMVTFTPTDTTNYITEYHTVSVNVNSATVWYVAEGGSGDGTSWTSPFGTIAEAITAASSGHEIRVKGGTYSGTTSPIVAMKEGVAIYGGFSGVDSTRDYNAYPSYIDGAHAYRCVVGANNATLDGFTVQNGAAPKGAGIFNNSVTPCVRNCIFQSNTAANETSEAAGAAMYNILNGGTLLVENCVFSTNSATSSARSTYGGAIYDLINSGAMIIRNCAFSGNTTVSNITSFGTTSGGGAVYNYVDSGAVLTTGCTFTANTSTGCHTEGGGECNYVTGGGNAQVNQCTFTSNLTQNDSTVSGYGAGLAYDLMDGNATLTNSSFFTNQATGGDNTYGGGVAFMAQYGKAVATNCVFVDNTATGIGGGAVALSLGGKIALSNCTFTQNSAGGGGACAYMSYSDPIEITNCIFWGDSASVSGPELFDPYGMNAATVIYSDIEAGTDTTNGNIAANPLFVDAANHNFRLQPGSPCINAGVTIDAAHRDIRGVTRPQGSAYDMGAYECASSIATWPTAADIHYGQPLSTVTLSGGNADVSGTFSFANGDSVLDIGSYWEQVTFTPSDAAILAAAGTTSEWVRVAVGKTTPAVTWRAAAILLGQSLEAASLGSSTAVNPYNATLSVPGTFAFDTPTETPTTLGTHAAAATFTPDDSSRYETVNDSASVFVGASDCTECTETTGPYELDATACLRVPDSHVGNDTMFTWSRADGTALNETRCAGVHCQMMQITNLHASDAGIYNCTYGAENAVYSVKIAFADEKTVPVDLSGVKLALLMIAFGLVGAWQLRRLFGIQG